MPNRRDIKTCSRCRQFKVRCDRTRPSCQRCAGADVDCSFLTALSTPGTSDGLSTPTTEATSDTVAGSGIDDLSASNLPHAAAVHLEDHDEAKAVEGAKIVKKRRRAHLSCTRCFRLKVKCDKELPCSRCRSSGWGRHCTYKHKRESSTPSPPIQPRVSAATGHDGEQLINSWHAQRRGATHWEQLVFMVSCCLEEPGQRRCSLILILISSKRRRVVWASCSATRLQRFYVRRRMQRMTLCFPATSHSIAQTLPSSTLSTRYSTYFKAIGRCASPTWTVI